MTARQRSWVAMLAIATLCAACSRTSSTTTSPSQVPDAITPTQVAAEYHVEAKDLALAPGWAWPSHPAPQDTGPDGQPIVYQRGYGTTAADHYWYCSWESYYVKPGLSPSASAAAYVTLKTVRKTEYYKVALLPKDKAYFDNELDQAGLGNNALMKTDVQLNCPAGPA